MIQLPHVELHEPRQEKLGLIPNDMGRDNSTDIVGDSRSIASTLHYLWQWGVLEDVGIMGAAWSASEDEDKMTLVVNNALQGNGEVVLSVNECLSALEQAEDGDVGVVHCPHTVRDIHLVEASDHLLQVGLSDEAIGQDILNDQAHLHDSLSGHGLAHAKLVGYVVETAGGGQLHDGDGHPLVWSEG